MVRVWEYDVPESARFDFERVYGSDGDWAQLFASAEGFLGTELFGSLSHPGRYITIDRFVDDDSWETFMTEHGDAYRRLGEATEGLTTQNHELA